MNASQQKKKKNKKRKKTPVVFGSNQKIMKVKESSVSNDLQQTSDNFIIFKSIERKIGSQVQEKVVPLPSDQVKRGPKITGREILTKETTNAQSKGKEILNWILWPIQSEQFFDQYFEKCCFTMKRSLKNFFDDDLTEQTIFQIFKEQSLFLNQDIFIYSDSDKTFNSNNMTLDDLNEIIQNKRANTRIRIKSFQNFHQNVLSYLSLLEEQFICSFDSSVDIYSPMTVVDPYQESHDQILIQFEGSSKFTIFTMEFNEENLSRHEGHFLSNEEAGSVSMEITLEKGDVLYLPRGTIYKSESNEDVSMVLIFGFSEMNSWVDLIEETFTKALMKAVIENLELRKSLPYDYGNHLGFIHSTKKTDNNQKQQLLTRRDILIEKSMELFKDVFENYIPKCIDDGADEMICKFLRSRKHPQHILSDSENGDEDEKQQNDFECTEKTKIKLISKYSIRIVKDEEDIVLYYIKPSENDDDDNADDNFDINDDQVQRMDISKPYQDAFVYLFNSYPKYVQTKDLPFESTEEKIDFASTFIEKEILLVE